MLNRVLTIKSGNGGIWGWGEHVGEEKSIGEAQKGEEDVCC